jgi:hypothetical protein
MPDVAATLAADNPVNGELATKFYEHFLWIASPMSPMGPRMGGCGRVGRDPLRPCTPEGRVNHAPSRPGPRGSPGHLLVHGLHTRYAGRLPVFLEQTRWFTWRHSVPAAHNSSPGRNGYTHRRLLSLVSLEWLCRILARVLLIDYGIRSISRVHAGNHDVFVGEGRNTESGPSPPSRTQGRLPGRASSSRTCSPNGCSPGDGGSPVTGGVRTPRRPSPRRRGRPGRTGSLLLTARPRRARCRNNDIHS